MSENDQDILQILDESDGKWVEKWSIRVRFLAAQEEIGVLQKHLANAIIEEREGIMLGFLGIFALAPLILFGGFPSWAYVSAGFFSILGSVTMTHGSKRVKIINEQLCRIPRIALG